MEQMSEFLKIILIVQSVAKYHLAVPRVHIWWEVTFS